MTKPFQAQDFLLPYVILAETLAQVTTWADQENIEIARCYWAADSTILTLTACQIVHLPGWHNVPDADRLPAEAHLDTIQPGWRP